MIALSFSNRIGTKHAEELKNELETDSADSNVSFMKTILSKPELTTEDAMILMTDVIFAGIESVSYTSHHGLSTIYNMF
jgi:hypothetical protein